MRSRAASISLNVIMPCQCGWDMNNRQDRHRSRQARGRRRLTVERLPDFGGQLLGIEWLWQEKHFRFAAVARLERFFEIPRDEENFNVGMNRTEGIGKAAPAHLRHHQIGKKEVDFSSAV